MKPVSIRAVAGLATLLTITLSRAQTAVAARVVVLTDTVGDPLARLVVDGLTSAGVPAELLPPSMRGMLDPEALDLVASARRADVLLRVNLADHTVEVWRRDTPTAHLAFRETIGAPASSFDDTALRTVDVVRAEVSSLPAPAVNAQPQTATTAGARPRTAPARVAGLEIDAGVLYAPGGLSASGTAHLRGLLHGATRFVFGVELGFPLGAGQVNRPEGSAFFTAYQPSGFVGVQLLPAGRTFQLRPVVGAGAIIGLARGLPAPGFIGVDASGVSAALWGGLDALLAFTPQFGLVLDARVGTSTAVHSLRFVDREVATWGTPYVSVALGLALDL